MPQATSSVRTAGRLAMTPASRRARPPSRAGRGRRTGPGRATSRRTRARAGRSTPSLLPRVRGVELPLESVPNFSEGRDAGDDRGARCRARSACRRCSTFTRMPTTTGRCSRSSATSTRSSRRCWRGSPVRASASTCASTKARIRGSARQTSCRSSPSIPPIASVRGIARCGSPTRIGAELGLPVFLYGDSAPGRGPAFYRRGGPEELQRRIDAGELSPDFGPRHARRASRRCDRRGAPAPDRVQRQPRDRRRGGRARRSRRSCVRRAAVSRVCGHSGWRLPRAGRAQVSMNVED